LEEIQNRAELSLSVISEIEVLKAETRLIGDEIERKRERNARKNALDTLKVGVPSTAIVVAIVVGVYPESVSLLAILAATIITLTSMVYLITKQAPTIGRTLSSLTKWIEGSLPLLLIMTAFESYPEPIPGPHMSFLYSSPGAFGVVLFIVISIWSINRRRRLREYFAQITKHGRNLIGWEEIRSALLIIEELQTLGYVTARVVVFEDTKSSSVKSTFRSVMEFDKYLLSHLPPIMDEAHLINGRIIID